MRMYLELFIFIFIFFKIYLQLTVKERKKNLAYLKTMLSYVNFHKKQVYT